MYVENYTVKIINNCRKPARTIKIAANTAQEAHKKALFNTNYFTEEITQISDSSEKVVYTLSEGFCE
jgi:hypothetical protein